MRIEISHNISTPLSPDKDTAMTDRVLVDVNSIPDHVREDLAKATYETVCDFLQQPGGRDRLNARITLKKSLKKERN